MATDAAVTTYHADILEITGQPVKRIRLQLPAAYQFAAGQYLMVKAPDGIDIPMSIASAPSRLPELELHYRAVPNAPEAAAMDRLLKGKQLLVSDAAGDVTVGNQDTPLIIVAGGSGAAQAFSCAEERNLRGTTSPTTILWCADQNKDIYLTEQLGQYKNVSLEVCIDDRRTADNEGLLWLRENCHTFLNCQVILAGSPGFVYTVTDTLLAAGFKQSALHSDIYAYAPRA